MGLIERNKLIAEISPPFDQSLTERLVDEFIAVERRYVLRDWEPAELDGGQFAEILVRILYHLDSGNLNPSKGFDDCAQYIEKDGVPHAITPRQQALHLTRVLRTIYKFRSQRGAVHISPNYAANQMDARLIVECVRWCFSECLRLYWKGDREAVAKAIRELIEFDVPCIGKFEDTLLVQRTDVSAEDEILILLHYAGVEGFSRAELGRFVPRHHSTVSNAIDALGSRQRRLIILQAGRFRLTDLGSKFVREQLGHKLALS